MSSELTMRGFRAYCQNYGFAAYGEDEGEFDDSGFTEEEYREKISLWGHTHEISSSLNIQIPAHPSYATVCTLFKEIIDSNANHHNVTHGWLKATFIIIWDTNRGINFNTQEAKTYRIGIQGIKIAEPLHLIGA